MISRIRLVGIALAVVGLLFVAAGAYAFTKYQEGDRSLQAFSKAQNVTLSYNDQGQLVDGGKTAGAQQIMKLLTKDWAYPVVQSDLNPKDPLVNTATEYMYQMATITTHVLDGTQTVVLDKDVEYKGKMYKAGSYEFKVDGRYYADFDRGNPIEGPARGMAWSATAMGLIGMLGVGTATASALQLALGLAGLFGAVGGLALLAGVGLVWASRRPVEVPVESVQTATVHGTVGSLLSSQPRR